MFECHTKHLMRMKTERMQSRMSIWFCLCCFVLGDAICLGLHRIWRCYCLPASVFFFGQMCENECLCMYGLCWSFDATHVLKLSTILLIAFKYGIFSTSVSIYLFFQFQFHYCLYKKGNIFLINLDIFNIHSKNVFIFIVCAVQMTEWCWSMNIRSSFNVKTNIA